MHKAHFKARASQGLAWPYLHPRFGENIDPTNRRLNKGAESKKGPKYRGNGPESVGSRKSKVTTYTSQTKCKDFVESWQTFKGAVLLT
jgi:hypothetical protein